MLTGVRRGACLLGDFKSSHSLRTESALFFQQQTLLHVALLLQSKMKSGFSAQHMCLPGNQEWFTFLYVRGMLL